MKKLFFFLNTRDLGAHHRREEIFEYHRQAKKFDTEVKVFLQPKCVFLSRNKTQANGQDSVKAIQLWCLIPLSLAEKSPLLMWLLVNLPVYWQLRKFNVRSSVSWFYRPEQRAYIPRKSFNVFLMYDHYVADSELRKREKVERELRKCFNQSDIVLVCSKKLLNEYASDQAKFLYYPNAISNSLIDGARRASQLDSAGSNNKVKFQIGFVGNMDQSFDVSLVEYLVSNNVDMEFVFVGPYSKSTSVILEQYKNVRMTGRVDYSMLSRYIASFDLCICPYKQDEFSSYRNPLKVFEYLAHNKPVVATRCDLPENITRKITIVASDTSFSDCLKNTKIFRQPFSKEELERYYKSNSWQARVELVFFELGRLNYS